MNISKLLLGMAFGVVFVGGLAVFDRRVEAQDDSILPGCSIPKSYGRLVAIMNAPNTGLAGQAVFEDPDGRVRWVALMFSGDLPRLPKAQQRSEPMFPTLPRYECSLGHVWQRH